MFAHRMETSSLNAQYLENYAQEYCNREDNNTKTCTFQSSNPDLIGKFSKIIYSEANMAHAFKSAKKQPTKFQVVTHI